MCCVILSALLCMPEQMYPNIPQQPFCSSSVYAHRVSRAHREAGSMAASSASAMETTDGSGTCPYCNGKSTIPYYQWHLPPVPLLQWEIHVEFANDMWWAMPHELSERILNEWKQGCREVSFVWNWGERRQGTYTTPEGEGTNLNRYTINFETMKQRNDDSRNMRTVKVVAVLR